MDILGLTPSQFFLIIFIIILAAQSIKNVKESERIAVYRLGRFIGIRGPGLVLIIPFTDKAFRINLNELNEKIPGWQILPNEELSEKMDRSFGNISKKGG